MSDEPNEDGEAPKKKSKKTLFIVLGLILVLLLGGGGAGWYFTRGKAPHDAKAEAEKAEAAKKAARAFVTLEPFVVNLADRDDDRYAQIGLVLEVADKKTGDQVSSKMPAIRNAILLLLSSKQAEQLTTREGKEKLASEVAVVAAEPLGWTPPKPRPAKPQAKAAAPDDSAEADSEQKVESGSSDAADAEEAEKVAAEPPKPPPSNPIAQVHFSSFIVQ